MYAGCDGRSIRAAVPGGTVPRMRCLGIAIGVGLVGLVAAAASPSPAAAQPTAYPSKKSVRAVKSFVSRRATSSFALVDSRGRLHGYQARRRYASGSIVKLMLLVAYLRRLEGRMPPPGDQQLLHTMIVLSGNKVASIIQGKVGTAALWEVARDAGMRDFSVSGSWGSSLISAADQARFFRRFDRMIPAGTRDYARDLMSSIDRRQRWGFPRPALDLGFEAFFKIGWRGTAAGPLRGPSYASIHWPGSRREVTPCVRKSAGNLLSPSM